MGPFISHAKNKCCEYSHSTIKLYKWVQKKVELHYTKLKRLPRDKHSCSLVPFLSYKKNMSPNFPVQNSFGNCIVSMMYCLLLSKNALKTNLMANPRHHLVSLGILNTWCGILITTLNFLCKLQMSPVCYCYITLGL